MTFGTHEACEANTMSGLLNDRIGEQGLPRGQSSEVALRALVTQLEGLPAQKARETSGAGVNDCERGVRKSLVSAGGPWGMLQFHYNTRCFLRAYTSDLPSSV